MVRVISQNFVLKTKKLQFQFLFSRYLVFWVVIYSLAINTGQNATMRNFALPKVVIVYKGKFLTTHKLMFFFGQLEGFLKFFSLVVRMYLKVCAWLDTQETPHTGGAGYIIHNDGHMIPRNDVLIVSSLPPD